MTEATVTPEKKEKKEEEQHADFLVELSTKVEPAKKFTIDGEEYELYGFEHLSDDDEAKITAAFSKHQRLINALNRAKNDGEAMNYARKLRTSRIHLISLLTSCTEDIVEGLPISAQATLLETIQESVGGASDSLPYDDQESEE